MLKKRIAVFIAVLMVSLFCASPVAAAPAATVPLYTGDGENSGSGGETPAPGGLEITGYEIQSGGVVPTRITKGMGIGLLLTIADRRPEATKYDPSAIEVIARLNSSSFRLMSDHAIDYRQQVTATGDGLIYVIYFELIYTGEGNTFQADLYYQHRGGGVADIPVYPLSLSLNQCQPPQESEGGGTEVKGTGFVLKSASYGTGNVEAGNNFVLSAEVLSTNGAVNVENVTVGITPPEQITLAEGSSLVYIGTVGPNQTIPVNFTLFPGANIEDGSYTVAIDIKGVSAQDGSEVSATVNFSIPIIQPERFEVFESQLPGFLTLGMDDGSGYGSVTLVNQGKGTVSNVSVEVVGDGIASEDGKQYLGHIAGGEQKTADFLLTATEPGEVDAKVVVSYESASGEKKTLEEAFTVQVEDGGMMVDPMPMEPEPVGPQGGFPIWGIALIVIAVIVAGAVFLVLFLRRRRARKAALEEAELAEDDEDEEDGEDTPDEFDAAEESDSGDENRGE